jgi:hypothetical protein
MRFDENCSYFRGSDKNIIADLGLYHNAKARI